MSSKRGAENFSGIYRSHLGLQPARLIERWLKMWLPNEERLMRVVHLYRSLLLTVCCTAMTSVVPAYAAPVDFAMLPALENAHPAKMTMLDVVDTGKRLVATGEQGLIIHSTDKGATWQQANVPVSVTITSVFFIDSENGWATGHQGVILNTTDGGQNWQLQFRGRDAQQQVLDLAKAREQQLNKDIESAPNDDEAEDLQYQLDDLQATIDDATKALADGPAEPLLDIWFGDDKNGLAVGAYGLLLLTSDGGQHWKLHPDYLQNADKYHFYSIAALDANTLIVAGEQGVLWRSRDHGATWEALKSPYQGSFFGASKLHDGSLLIYGLRNRVYRSADAGETWQDVQTGNQSTVLGGGVFGKKGVVLLTSEGGVLVSQDDARTFKLHQLSDHSANSAAILTAADTVLVVGRAGVQSLSIK
jgi:photosystem II stability/assembly factor-like uncharacterized protein